MQKRLTVGLVVLFALVAARLCSLGVILPPGKTATLKWDYPYDTSAIVFNVYGTTNLSTPMKDWTLLTNVTELACLVPIRGEANFFTVAASNTVTRLQSRFGN